ncbi:hypothetical protein IVB34_45005 [Bradyrhizobium sp. 2]|nr:hypothetical protein [Bradyrhizobium sp. 2]
MLDPHFRNVRGRLLALLWQNVFSPLFFQDLLSAIWALVRRRPKDEIDDGVTYGGHGSNHARIAEAFGIKSWQVNDPNEIQAVFDASINHDGPTLIDIIAQPLEESKVPVSKWMG